MTSLFGMASGLPHLIVDLVALTLAVSRWSRHPMASMFLAVGTVLRLVTMLSNVFLARLFVSGDAMGAAFALSGLVSAAGAGLTVAAVFADREKGDEAPKRPW
ncbi:MAG: hypothetical protein IT380_28770 [Myxococcales bacterium]|nr:hypothetical protein [Myxococcales bacterium]